MTEAIRSDIFYGRNNARTIKPSETQQPSYDDHCYQCGRPITGDNKDHSGKKECDGALVDEKLTRFHHSVANHAAVETVERLSAEARKARDAQASRIMTPSNPCMATKQGPHLHACNHGGGHFGFHECVECRQLWM